MTKVVYFMQCANNGVARVCCEGAGHKAT